MTPAEADALGAALRDAWERGRERWQVALGIEAFAEHLRPRLPEGDPRDGLSGLHSRDLYLACACAQGSEAAIRAFDEEFMTTLPAMVSRLEAPASVVEDVRQSLLTRLMVGTTDRPPAIETYSGRGALAGWLKVVAMRATMAALDQRDAVMTTDDEVRLLTTGGRDPELDLIRDKHGEAFREAFRVALGELEPRARKLLRSHLVERLSIDDLAKIEDVHRSTVARWLVRLREEIHAATMRELAARLQLDDAQCQSLVRALESQLAVTIAPHLQSQS